MRFQDIPQFTRMGSWECDYDIVRFSREIVRLEAEEGLQLNPDFQRGNVWTQVQQSAFVEFILRGGKTSRVVYLNNPSWNKRATTTYNDFVCVDGLQRIKAIRAFVNDEIPVLGYTFHEYEGSPRIVQTMKIHVNDLQTRKEVLQWYIDFNAGGTVHSDKEIERVRKLMEEENATEAF